MAETPEKPPIKKDPLPTRLWAGLTATQAWKSIFRHDRPKDTRSRAQVILSNVFLHLHPARIRVSGLRVRYTWCMGGLTFFVFLTLVLTGVLLMFYYRPTAEYAFKDIQDLSASVPFGIMRELHRWGAHLMIITVWLHMLRVFLTGAYKPPREFNWGVGVILLVLTMFLSYTGYLLPFDQLAMWAVTVGSNMARATPVIGHEGPGAPPFINASNDARFGLLAGRFVGEGTLLRFYVLHCVFVPIIAVIFMAVHFWRVRKDGGVSGPL